MYCFFPSVFEWICRHAAFRNSPFWTRSCRWGQSSFCAIWQLSICVCVQGTRRPDQETCRTVTLHGWYCQAQAWQSCRTFWIVSAGAKCLCPPASSAPQLMSSCILSFLVAKIVAKRCQAFVLRGLLLKFRYPDVRRYKRKDCYWTCVIMDSKSQKQMVRVWEIHSWSKVGQPLRTWHILLDILGEAVIALPCCCVEAAAAKLARRRLLLTLKAWVQRWDLGREIRASKRRVHGV